MTHFRSQHYVVTLTFDVWPWNCCALLLLTNFGVARMFHSRLIGQHLSDASRDLATLTFYLGGHGACGWCVSSCSVCIPSLNFVGLPFGRYCAFIVWAVIGLVTLTFDLETGAQYRPRCKQPAYQFWCSRSFCSRHIGQQLSDASCDLSTLIIDLGGHGACQRCGSSSSVCILGLKFVGLSVREIWFTSCLNIMSAGPGDLDLWPWSWCAYGGQPSYQFWCLWDVSFSTYRPNPVRRITWPCDLDLWPFDL